MKIEQLQDRIEYFKNREDMIRKESRQLNKILERREKGSQEPLQTYSQKFLRIGIYSSANKNSTNQQTQSSLTSSKLHNSQSPANSPRKSADHTPINIIDKIRHHFTPQASANKVEISPTLKPSTNGRSAQKVLKNNVAMTSTKQLVIDSSPQMFSRPASLPTHSSLEENQAPSGPCQDLQLQPLPAYCIQPTTLATPKSSSKTQTVYYSIPSPKLSHPNLSMHRLPSTSSSKHTPKNIPPFDINRILQRQFNGK